MYRFSRLCLRNRAVVALVSIAIVVGGALAITNLRQEMLPSMGLPVALISAQHPGVGAEMVEDQLAAAIEGAAEAVPEVQRVETTSIDSAMFTVVEFSYSTNMDTANQKISTALSRIQQELPDGVVTNIQTGSMDDLPIVTLAVRGPDAGALDRLVNEMMLPRLNRLEHIRAITVVGAVPEQIRVSPDPAALAANGVTWEQLSEFLAGAGLSWPAGEVIDGDRQLSVQAGGPITSVEALRDLPLKQGLSGVLRLSDLADVVLESGRPSTASRLNGSSALALSLTKTPDGNTVDVSHAIQDALKDMTPALEAEGLSSAIVFDQAPFIENSIDGLMEEGLIGLAFAIIVILVFLLSMRATLVSAVSIPLSLLITFIGLLWSGETLNILTLGAITVAIGRVVDDSIVVIENIQRHLSYGVRKKKAILGAVREVGGAVASSTFCTAAVFIPLAFVGGIVGELFRPFGLTVALALFASLLVALTIVPVLSYWFVQAPASIDAADRAQQRVEAERRERHGLLQRGYLATLRLSLRHRAITVAIAVLIVEATLALLPGLKTNFMGEIGGETVIVTQKFESGTALEVEDAETRVIERELGRIDGVSTVLTQVRPGGFNGLEVSAEPRVTYRISVEQGADLEFVEDMSRQTAVNKAGDHVTETSVSVGGFSLMYSTTVDLVVRSPNMESLREGAAMVEDAVKESQEGVDVANSITSDQPRVRVTVDPEKVLDWGLTERSTNALLRGLMVPVETGKVEIDNGELPVVLEMGEPAEDLTALESLPLLETPAGTVILSDVATVEVVEGPVALDRVDGERSATISVAPASQDVGLLAGQLSDAVEGVELPPGVSVEVAGLAAEMSDSFGELGIALGVAVMIVFIIMVATFGSLIQPFILLISIPFAATGALLMLVVTGIPLGVPAFIGLLLLVGIVVANAIVLIDLINQYRRAGRSLDEAITEGARKRLRPILMTAAATVFALIPMALGLTGGGGSFISQPLALVVIGGLISSTVLTLIVVPVLYRFEAQAHDRRLMRRAARFEARRQARIVARDAAARADEQMLGA
ncbi:MAG: efflux RND transporter permease subunit [Bifidobacteriaceae bacterium]|jgi:HAE1 family hydrophobic/amphiphilic exporter-1|nr:efflux RND transporter permease subunit [Bifidobacteriaceae bacterium]